MKSKSLLAAGVSYYNALLKQKDLTGTVGRWKIWRTFFDRVLCTLLGVHQHQERLAEIRKFSQKLRVSRVFNETLTSLLEGRKNRKRKKIILKAISPSRGGPTKSLETEHTQKTNFEFAILERYFFQFVFIFMLSYLHDGPSNVSEDTNFEQIPSRDFQVLHCGR